MLGQKACDLFPIPLVPFETSSESARELEKSNYDIVIGWEAPNLSDLDIDESVGIFFGFRSWNMSPRHTIKVHRQTE